MDHLNAPYSRIRSSLILDKEFYIVCRHQAVAYQKKREMMIYQKHHVRPVILSTAPYCEGNLFPNQS